MLEVNTRWESHITEEVRLSPSVCTMTSYVRKASSNVADVQLNAKPDMLDDVLLGQLRAVVVTDSVKQQTGSSRERSGLFMVNFQF